MSKVAKAKYNKKKVSIPGIIVTIILMAGTVMVIIPLVWMLSTALKTNSEIYTNSSFIPEAWAWNNFYDAWTSAPFGRYLVNTLIVTLTGMTGALLSNCIIAYGFARIKFKGREVVFALVLATMMIPGVVMQIPTFIIFSKLGWVNTFLPLTVPAFFGSAYYIFLLRQFFRGIPMAYSEAAKLEGANEFQVLSRIVMPMSVPIIITIAIFEFNAKWNDFMGPLLYLNDMNKYTLQIGLKSFKGDSGVIWNQFMAASLLVLLPSIIIFALLQKHILKSVNIGGLKG